MAARNTKRHEEEKDEMTLAAVFAERKGESGKRGRWEGCRTKALEVKRNTWWEVVVAARNTKRKEMR